MSFLIVTAHSFKLRFQRFRSFGDLTSYNETCSVALFCSSEVLVDRERIFLKVRRYLFYYQFLSAKTTITNVVLTQFGGKTIMIVECSYILLV